MHVNWHEVRRRVSQAFMILGCWALVVLILERIIAPFGPLRRSFPVYGVVVPMVALSFIVLALAKGWLWVGLPGEEPRMRVRHDVSAFAGAMEAKLAEKDQTFGPRGWASDTPASLLGPLVEHVEKLDRAIRFGLSPETIRRAAADVGNFAMMIHTQAKVKAGRS